MVANPLSPPNPPPAAVCVSYRSNPMANETEILDLLLSLEDFFGAGRADDPKYKTSQHDICFRLFANTPAEVLDQARDDLYATSKWLPKVVEIRDAVHTVERNYGKAVSVDEDPTGQLQARRLYWLAMEAYNNSL